MADDRNFRDHLKASGLSQSEFARLTGTPLRTVQHWAGGHRRVPGIAIAWLDLYDEIERLKARIRSLGGKV